MIDSLSQKFSANFYFSKTVEFPQTSCKMLFHSQLLFLYRFLGMEKTPLLVFIATSYYFRIPVFNEIFKILLAKILFQKRQQTNVRMNKI